MHLVIAVMCAVVLVSGCSRQPAAPEPSGYQPFYSMPRARPQAGAPANELKADFDRAASSRTKEEARERWRLFLEKYRPKDDEYGDAFERNHVRAAQYELMRLEYLLGNVEGGDKLLNQLEDVRRGQ